MQTQHSPPSIPSSQDSGQRAALSLHPETLNSSTSGTAVASTSPVPAWRMSLRVTSGDVSEKLVWPRGQHDRASCWPAAPRQAPVLPGTAGYTCHLLNQAHNSSVVQPPLALTTVDESPCEPPTSHVNPTECTPSQIPYCVRSSKHDNRPDKKIFLPGSICGLSSGIWGTQPICPLSES